MGSTAGRFLPAAIWCCLLPMAASGCGGDDPAPKVGAGGTPHAQQGAGPASGTGFEERAVASGIGFRMEFLRGEQGENFKINLYDHGCATAAADFDGDGDDDLLFLNQFGSNALYRNDGVRDGALKFTDVTDEAGVGLRDRVCVGACFADIDDDGDQDLFVSTTRGGNAMFRNDAAPGGTSGGAVKFTDVTAACGLSLVAHSETPCFFDYDGDGDLDLFLTNTAKWTSDVFDPTGKYFVGPSNLFDLVASAPEPNRMYRNEGGWKFTDVTETAGLAGPGWGGDVAVFDFDGDHDLDLFVGNMFGGSVLYRNDGGAKFTDVTKATLGKVSWGAVGTKVFDHDCDGRLDLFIADMHSDMWMGPGVKAEEIEPRVRYPGPEGPMVDRGQMPMSERDDLRAALRVDIEASIFGSTLFRNLGGGKFEERGIAANVETFWPWGTAAADYDLDGDEDMYIPSGMGYPFLYWPAAYLENNGKGRFEDVAGPVGLAVAPDGPTAAEMIGGKLAARSGRTAVVADFDGDGRPDIAANNFNERAYLYLNRLPMRQWIGLRLTATAGPRDAIGATAVITSGGRTMIRQVDPCGGYLAQSTRVLHFGLGDAADAVTATVQWPDGTTQTVGPLAPGRVHDVLQKGKR